MQLRQFQEEGVRFIQSKNGSCILGDEMGLGKTIQAIEFVKKSTVSVTLIVCPSSLKYNWEKEFLAWTDLGISVITKKWIGATVVIINYDLLKKFEKEIMAMGFYNIIIDEAHYCKSPKSQRTKLITKICQGIPHKLFLTGTPLADRPRDLFPILKILSPTMPWYHRNLCEDYWTFGKRFCGLHKKEITIRGGQRIKVLDDSGCTNKQELSEILKGVMLRRLKTDVLTELPAKNKTIIPVCESDKDEEDMFKEQMQRDEEEGIPPAQLIEKYRQYAVMKKIPEAINFISDICDNEKCVVFIHHREAGNGLWKGLKQYNPLAITGGMTPEERQQAVDKFQKNTEHKVIICSIKAAGAGLTLTAASKAVFLEPTWTPSELSQAEDRIHRIGQDDKVNIYYLTIKKSIESAMFKLLVEKNSNISQIVDGQKQNLFA